MLPTRFTRFTAAMGIVAACTLETVPSTPAAADLVLNEVLYDPAGADEGAEFVELWNPDSTARSLAGVTLETADGARGDVWTVVFRGDGADTVGPGAPFLVAGAAIGVPLQNGPDAIRLLRDGDVLDRLGYGDLVASALAEELPAPDVSSGHSLARREDGRDTDRNGEDWEEEAAPTPGRANHPPERLTFVPGAWTVTPIVPWPGDRVSVEATVVNRGRQRLEGSRWSFLLGWESRAGTPLETWGAASAAEAVGVPLAPGESAHVAADFDAPPEGPFTIRARLAAATGPSAPDLCDTLLIPGRTRAAPVIISEIAFRDAGAGEWIEVWVREPLADIGLLAIADDGSPPRPLVRGALPRPLPAGSLLVVAQDPAAVRARYGVDSALVLGVLGGWPSLNDADGPKGFADIVRIQDSEGVPCDGVPYQARSVLRGGTLERLCPDLPGYAAGSWGECVDPARATPARANSLRAPGGSEGVRGSLIHASGRVLRPGAPPLLLRLTPEARGRLLVVQVHDLLGRPVRTLVRGQRFASEGAFAWDGRDAGGVPVRPGIYVIRAEAEPEPGLAPRHTSVPVAVAAGAVR